MTSTTTVEAAAATKMSASEMSAAATKVAAAEMSCGSAPRGLAHQTQGPKRHGRQQNSSRFELHNLLRIPARGLLVGS
jgi:hypothetical protein